MHFTSDLCMVLRWLWCTKGDIGSGMAADTSQKLTVAPVQCVAVGKVTFLLHTALRPLWLVLLTNLSLSASDVQLPVCYLTPVSTPRQEQN